MAPIFFLLLQCPGLSTAVPAWLLSLLSYRVSSYSKDKLLCHDAENQHLGWGWGHRQARLHISSWLHSETLSKRRKLWDHLSSKQACWRLENSLWLSCGQPSFAHSTPLFRWNHWTHSVVLKGCWSPVLCVLGGPQVNEFSWVLVPASRPPFSSPGSSSVGPSLEPVSVLACGGCWNGCWINEGICMLNLWCCSFYITIWQIEKIKHQWDIHM